jgi:hypothetical protein
LGEKRSGGLLKDLETHQLGDILGDICIGNSRFCFAEKRRPRRES